MKAYEKSLRSLIAWLHTLGDDGELGSGQVEAAVKATKRLQHALRTRDPRQIDAAVSEIARIFLSVTDR